MSTTTTDLTVVDRRTGELIDVRDADTERLAKFVTDLQDLRGELSDAESVVNDELVARLDREASWTLRVGDPTEGRQWEIKAPSPAAGTETYPPKDLEDELRKLVERGTISKGGAGKALTRQLAVLLNVPLDADLDELADAVKAAVDVDLAGVSVEVAKVEPVRKSVMAGINALRKVDGTNAALDRVKVTIPVGKRKAKVTLSTLDEVRR